MYLKELKQLLGTITLFDDSEDMVYLGDLEEKKLYYTSNLFEEYGLLPIREAGYTFEELNIYQEEKGYERISFDRDGVYRFFSVKTRIRPSEDGTSRWIIGRISKIKNQEKIDDFTGLYNLTALMEDLDDTSLCGETGYLMILGIDNLKNINTQYGREYGNRVLRMVGDELNGLGKSLSKVYRLDSDKFALNIIGTTKEAVNRLYEKIREALVTLCTISSGVAEYVIGDDGELVYQHAENALYSAKANGKNMQVFFSVEVYQKHLQFVELQEELRNSVRNGFEGFSVTFQPQIDAKTYRIAGAEALLAFHSSTRGKIGAEEFIAVLEQTKLIVEVGEWVLEKALWQCKKWRQYRADFCVSVNVSYIQLKDEKFMERVTEILKRVELPGKAIILEITESMRLQDYQYFNKIFYQLSKLGIRVSIDDFGTGYSSLSYLKSLAIDEIKIDRCFVSHVQHSAYNYRLLSNIIELAHSAHIQVCCEGVEMEGELTAIQRLNPDKIQGYLFARAYSVPMFENIYFRPETKEYQERLVKESYYRELESIDDDSLFHIRQEKIAAIVDGMEEMIYVRDLNDYSLYYLNAAGREATGMYDYKGKKCYEVLQGKDAPCEFCQNCNNANNNYNVWEVESKHLNKHFLLKEKNISWNGEIARLTVAVDVTEKENMAKKRLQELLDIRSADVLKTTNLGLWIIRMDPKTQKCEMYADKTMLEILGAKENLSPEECYDHWYSRINNGYYHYVNYGVRNMIEERRTVELSYTWNHPEKGLVSVRCLGLRVADSDGMICLEGYHREINEVDRPKFLPDNTTVIFEYNAKNHNVYYHNDRGSLAGTEQREENFPTCWIEKEMIHPRFEAYFLELFDKVVEKEDVDGMEFMLKTKSGSYEWFKLRIRHLVDEHDGEGTVLVLIDPAKQERALELDYMRQREFYQAILSEKEAYAEIDIESGRIVSAGGCWSSYKEESDQKEQDFVEIFMGHAKEFLHEEDFDKFEKFMSVEYMQEVLQAGKNIEKLEVRRRFGEDMHWAELTGHVFQDKIAGNIHALLYMKDIDAQKRQELEREIEATRDPLTGVFNRRKFEREVKKHMTDPINHGTGTLLIFDMDHFKSINDQRGHAEGDCVLKHLANVLVQTFRRRDIVGRLGGDEFVVFLRDMTNKEILDRRMEVMMDALHRYEGMKVTCSVGIAFADGEEFSYTKCMQEADEALYLSKEKGRDCYSYYDEI